MAGIRKKLPEQMKDRARSLRRNSSGPECRLWSTIRNGRLAGLKFRRQHVIGQYVVDYFCQSQRLVIELDGDSHDGMAEADIRRQAHLESHGYRVLRFLNDDVLNDLEPVLRKVLIECGIDPELPPSWPMEGPAEGVKETENQ
jgi:very-short-patch-repair endonuclease